MSELEKNAAAQAGKESVTPPAKAEKKAKSPDKKKDKKPNRVARWLKDLKGELKKVTWPSAKDTLKNVAVVIVCVLIVGAHDLGVRLGRQDGRRSPAQPLQLRRA